MPAFQDNGKYIRDWCLRAQCGLCDPDAIPTSNGPTTQQLLNDQVTASTACLEFVLLDHGLCNYAFFSPDSFSYRGSRLLMNRSLFA